MVAVPEYKWIVPEVPSKIKRKSVRYLKALEYLNEVKVCSRYDLNSKFGSHVVKRLLKSEKVGSVNLYRGGSKYRVSELFDVPQPVQSRLFIVYLKDEKEALIEYLAGLVRRPLNKGRVKALSWRLKSLDNNKTRSKVVQRAGYDHKNKYDECIEEFLESGLESARVDFPNVKLNSLYALLKDSIDKKGLKDKIRACRRKGNVYLVKLRLNV